MVFDGCIRGELQKYAKNSNFENFQSALYSTSVSMPVMIHFVKHMIRLCFWCNLEVF